ncbi:MAG: helix-turn-helix domain-containing protein [Pyrinomonadaceae bacterium]
MRLNNPISIEKKDQATSHSERASSLCALAKGQEEAGEFEAARATLNEYWQRVGDRPKLEGLDDSARAEVLLRVGALSGWIGSARQIPGSQEVAKDLITESARIFEELALPERVVEARTDLAICYWRAGAFDEARITLDDALMRLGNLESEQRLRILLNKAIVEKVSNRYDDALRLHREAAPLFDASRNDALKGKFHNEYAQVLKNIGLAEQREDYIDGALIEFSAARIHFEQAGHKRFQGRVENNEGFLFARLGRFKDAHEHLNRARLLFVNLKDKGSVAEVDDTRAKTFLAQARNDEAEVVARGAVKILTEGDEQSLIVGVMTTHATALARLGRDKEALSALLRAMNMADQAGDPDSGGIAALTVMEELSSVVSQGDLRRYYWKAETSLVHSQHPGIKFRLGECARKILAVEGTREDENKEEKRTLVHSQNGNRQNQPQLGIEGFASTEVLLACSLEEEVLRYEGGLIKNALEVSGGSVTRAARMLGITHQGLAFILNGRQRNLLSVRSPIKPRRRSIIRYR